MQQYNNRDTNCHKEDNEIQYQRYKWYNNIVSKIYSSKMPWSDSNKEINNPSFEADKEIDESAVNQLQDINILLQKRIKRQKHGKNSMKKMHVL